MDREDWATLRTVLVVGVICVGLFCAIQLIEWVGAKGGYKQGQIDAARGVWKYQLTTQPTGETLWVEKKER